MATTFYGSNLFPSSRQANRNQQYREEYSNDNSGALLSLRQTVEHLVAAFRGVQ